MKFSIPPVLVLVLGLHAHSSAASDPIPSVAVFPLVSQGVDSSTGGILTDAISDELLRSGKLRVMERSQMSAVLKEQGFQQSGSCDQGECAVQVGRLLGIDRIVVGSVGRLGESFTLNLRGVDVTTGEVLASDRKVVRGPIDKVLTEVLPPVAQSLAIRLGKVGGGAGKGGHASDSDRDQGAQFGSGKAKVWPWVVGGTVLVGGAAGAVWLLTQSKDSKADAPTTSFEATW